MSIMSYQQTNPAFHSYDSHPFLTNPNTTFPCLIRSTKKAVFPYHHLKFSDLRRNLTVRLSARATSGEDPLSSSWLRVAAASSILFFSLSVRLCRAAPTPLLSTAVQLTQEAETIKRVPDDHPDSLERFESQEKLNAAFETWKSKTYALSVPLNVVALRGSLPPSWVKDFMKSQGKRLQLRTKFLGSLENIFDDLCKFLGKRNVGPASAMAADIVTIGDSWLSFAIKKGIIEPVRDIEDQDWFKGLGDKWKVYLRRNHEGEIDSEGEVWAAPYRWGSMVIAYRKRKFQKHKLALIKDWADLWRPELEGRISMVGSPREVVGAVLKYMGASYNTKDIDLQVTGGRNAVQQNLVLLGRQVFKLLFLLILHG
uniref:Uncharacterized protein n=1 Tax=Rhizophora mucronata TaxID=61149 RepID=A0A2P2JCA5_RHIMU